MQTSRRNFLIQVAALSVAPLILPSSVWAAKKKPNDLITMGFIGMGKQNRYLLESFLQRKQVCVVAVCDVDTTRRDAALRQVTEYYKAHPERSAPECKAYNDFREITGRSDIDAVCIATPDHWHTIPTLAALESGKDVYCEKPLTHNIHESLAVMKAVKKHKRILQTGSMQRSMEEFRVACELVRNGAIGKVRHVECSFGAPGIPCDLPEEAMEPGLDWNMWIGPGPMRPYNSVLSPRGVHDHYPNWRTYKEYGGGAVCDWGAHHVDIAQWGLGMDESGPEEVHPPEDPKAQSGAVLVYKDGIRVIHTSGFGADFFGEEGEVKVNRGQFEFWLKGKKVAGFTKREDGGSLSSALSFVQKEYLKDPKVKLYESGDHIKNFLECVESRKRPITDEIVGGRSAICCHLFNQSYYNHAVIKWNPKKMCFAKDGGDPKWLTENYRSPWSV